MLKIVLGETLLYTMRGIELFQKRKDAQNAENGFWKKKCPNFIRTIDRHRMT